MAMGDPDLVTMGPGHSHRLVLHDGEVARRIEAVNTAVAQLTLELAHSSLDPTSMRLTNQTQVIVALATLQSSVQDLSRAYINHANTVLNPGRAGTLDIGLTTTLVEAGLLTRPPQDPVAAEEPAGEIKKKRKRAKHDPNAPKRALTPYFLYMQSARGQIARELGANAKPKEVADEGTRRWGAMKEEDKQVWNEEYQKNLAVYRVKTAAYKAGQPVPSDDEAQRLVDAGKVPVNVVEPEIEAATEDEDETSPEPVKEPEPPKSAKRRKTGDKAAPVAEEAPKPVAKPMPEKKSKKAKKEATPPPVAAVKTASEKKKKSSKKTA